MTVTLAMQRHGGSPTGWALKVEDDQYVAPLAIGTVQLLAAKNGNIVKCQVSTVPIPTKSGKTTWDHGDATCYFVGYNRLDQPVAKVAPVKVTKRAAKSTAAAVDQDAKHAVWAANDQADEVANLKATLALLMAKLDGLYDAKADVYDIDAETAEQTKAAEKAETIVAKVAKAAKRNPKVTPADMTAVAAKLPAVRNGGKIPCHTCGVTGVKTYVNRDGHRECDTCLDIVKATA